jgi:heme-degrading monooxygenase HmoA
VERLSELEEASEVVLVDHLTVAPDEAKRFAESWAEDVARMRRQPGFVSAQLRPVADGGADGYVSIVVWRSAELLPAARQHGESEAVRGASTRRFGAVEVDQEAREVRKGGEPVRLTLKEFELLLTLMSHPRRVFSRDELMDRVWGYRADWHDLAALLALSSRRGQAEPADGLEPSTPPYDALLTTTRRKQRPRFGLISRIPRVGDLRPVARLSASLD